MQWDRHSRRHGLTALLMVGGSLFAMVSAEADALDPVLEEPVSITLDPGLGTDPEEALRRLSEAQVALMTKADAPLEAVWPQTRACLEAWEASTRIEEARRQYMALLLATVQALRGEDTVSFEADLRTYLERAATLAETEWERALFRLGVAESLLRDRATPTEAGRVDSLLREVIEALPERAPKDLAYALRCRHFMEPAGAAGEVAGESLSDLTLSEALRYLRALLEVEDGNPALKEPARRAVEALLKREAVVERLVRFAPFEAIRLPVKTRNVETLRYAVTPLRIAAEAGPLRRAQVEAVPLEGLIPVFQETLMFADGSSDWATGVIEIEEGLPAGWYALEVSGTSLTERGLILVGDLEVIAFPGAEGWEVRVFEWPSAKPLEGARVVFHGADGPLFAEQITDAEGRVTYPAEAGEAPVEVAVLAGDQPAVLPLEKADEGDFAEPLQVAVYPRVVRQGDSVRWFAVGELGKATGVRFKVPGGQVFPADVLQVGAGWVSGEVVLETEDRSGGPLYVEQPDGTWSHVAHLEQAMTPSLAVRPVGERLYPGFAIYAATDFVGLEVEAMAAEEPLPEYVRVEVRTLQRRMVLGPEEAHSTESRPPYQEVIEMSSRGPVEVPLGSWSRPAEWTAFVATVHPLGSSRELGRTVFALAAERETVLVSGKERLVRLGDALDLSIERPWGSEEAAGDLVVYRETWQSRYLHRKRGTFISESDYMALPERSLLGTAKTDYELFEEGFVREEAQRLEVALEGSRQEMSLQFSRPGYYRIEWEAGEGEMAVGYPEGPVEVWVIPPDGDLKPFRAKRPRLVLERSAEGDAEVLLLMDRPRRTTLLRWGEGAEAQVRVLETGDAAALFVELPGRPEADETLLEAVIIGERFSESLRAVLADQGDGPAWELDSGKRIGLRPGSVMDWQVRVPEKNLPLWWTFEKALPFAETRERSEPANPEGGGELRALSRMYSVPSTLPEPLDLPASRSMFPRTPRAVMALYPELDLGTGPPPFLPQILDQGSPFPMPRSLQATLPEQPGSWDLVVFGVKNKRLETLRWRISTELPVQIALEGPERLRLGDRAVYGMRLRNSLPTALNLSCEARFPELLQIEQVAPRFLQLPPLRTVSLELPVTAHRVGEGAVAVRLANEEVETEEARPLVAMEPATRPAWRCVFGMAGGEPLEIPLQDGPEIPGRVILAPGVGSLLSPLWTGMRSAVRPDDTLLMALGDWVVSAALSYHGAAPFLSLEEASSSLALALASHAVPSGGWSYLPGGPASLRLSCDIVASLEIGAFQGDPALSKALSAGRAFLEQQLLSTAQPVQERLHVLRVVSLSAAYGKGRGPTRLEARHFLDLFQRREDLTLTQLALLLQTAANFAFEEEVRLLSEAVLSRYDASETAPAMALSEKGLLYGILTRDIAGGERAEAVLREVLRGLGEDSPVTGWEPFAAFAALAADYYWRGDFEVEGRYAYAVGEGPFTEVDIGARLAEATVMVPLQENPTEAVAMRSLHLDTRHLSVGLFALVQGAEPQSRACPEHPGSEALTRRYYEERTLLRGSLAKTVLLSGMAPVVREQDELVREVIVRGLPRAAPIEVELPLPAGLIPLAEAAQVEHLRDGGKHPWSNWRLEWDEAAHVLRLIACTPEVGDLRLTVRMRVRWVGDFLWPAPVLIDRLAGTCHRLGDPVRLEIRPADLSAPEEE